MKQISLRLISIVLAILIIVSLAGCSKGNNLNVLSFLDYHKATYAADKDLNGVVCENDAWQLIWDDENKSVSFYDKYTDTMWGNTATEITDLQNVISELENDQSDIFEMLLKKYKAIKQKVLKETPVNKTAFI